MESISSLKEQVPEKYVKEAQKCLADTPVIILGSGASAPFNIPNMSILLEYLEKNIKVDEAVENDIKAWSNFLNISQNKGLEGALSEINLSPQLMQQLIDQTWRLINREDQEAFKSLIEGQRTLPLTKLIKHLFRSTHRLISIITPNYDRLAEYSSNQAGFNYFNGFRQGYIQAWEPEKMPCKYSNLRSSGREEPLRTVCIWKVHGSLDWFEDKNEVISSFPFTTSMPSQMKPLVITPGTQKYRKAHTEPFRTILSQSDKALENAKAFLCVGYGFNDEHIQPKLIKNCNENSALIVVLARTMTEAAKKFLLQGKCKKFLAFEKSNTGTRVYSPECLQGHELKELELWDFEQFLNYVLSE